jgi:hypothetical protein
MMHSTEALSGADSDIRIAASDKTYMRPIAQGAVEVTAARCVGTTFVGYHT